MFGLFEKLRRSPRARLNRRPEDENPMRTALAIARAKRDHAREHELLVELAEQEPCRPRWARKLGDVLRKLGQQGEAIDAYRRAAQLYADKGFARRARAMTHLARTIGGRSVPLQPQHPSLRPEESLGCI
jgi:DNA-binding SARP family transcriptional activator